MQGSIAVTAHVTVSLRQVVLDCTDARGLAEFYRQLLRFRYREGDEAPALGEPDHKGQDWLVLRNPAGGCQLAFQKVQVLPEVTWPDGPHPQMAHLDLRVPTKADLDAEHGRALGLGARLRVIGLTIRRNRYASTRTRRDTRSASLLPASQLPDVVSAVRRREGPADVAEESHPDIGPQTISAWRSVTRRHLSACEILAGSQMHRPLPPCTLRWV